MTKLHKLFITLLILVLVFGAVALFSEPDVTLATQNQPEASRYSASVAWLEICAVLDTDFMATPLPAKTHMPT